MDLSVMSDAQAEAGIIATLIFRPDFLLHSDNLEAGYFYNTDNSCLFWAIRELYRSDVVNIDAFNLSTMLNSNTAVKRTIESYNLPETQEYINMCSAIARSTLDEYKILVNKIISLSFKRDMYRTLSTLQNECANPDKTLKELNTSVSKRISSLTEKYVLSGDIKIFGETIDELWSGIENRRNESGFFGIPSKFPLVNEYFTYETGELVLVSARMKAGKSALLMNECIHKLMNGVPTVYFDTELTSEHFFTRMLSNLTGIEIKRIKTGEYSPEEKGKLDGAMDWIKQQPFVHKYLPTVSQDEIYSTCKILKTKIDLQFVVYDYLKGNSSDSSVLYNQLGALTDFLKNEVAGELELAVLAAAQLNRSGMIADSDKLERYCSVSVRWRRKEDEELVRENFEHGNYAMTIVLNRIGEQMMDDEHIDFQFDGSTMRIAEATQREKTDSIF